MWSKKADAIGTDAKSRRRTFLGGNVLEDTRRDIVWKLRYDATRETLRDTLRNNPNTVSTEDLTDQVYIWRSQVLKDPDPPILLKIRTRLFS